MTTLRSIAANERPLVAAIFLLVASLCLGGGGSTHRLAELLIEMTAILAAALTFAWPLPAKTQRIWHFPLFLLSLWAVLVLVQLVPLPASLWRALPGRELASAIADQIGTGSGVHPLTLDPSATRRALAALLPAGSMLMLVLHMDQLQRSSLALTAIGCAFASLMLGLFQLVTAGHWGTLYQEGHLGYATGLFANRNHQASFLLIAAALACGLAAKRHAATIPLLLIIASLLAGALATRSRAALLLFPLALLPLLQGRLRLQSRVILPAILASTASLWVLLQTNQVVQITVDRLWNGNMGRLLFWKDSWSAISLYWPAGSGFGTFASVFRVSEPLEHLGQHYVNHAHNELLEIMLEGGLPALVLFVAGFCWWAKKAPVLWKTAGPAPQLGAAAWTGLLLLMLHSLVDYPARMLPIEVMAAMLVGFMLPPARRTAASGVPSNCHSKSGKGRASSSTPYALETHRAQDGRELR
ncbi:O-antigen ligase family protein (plasmid) [Novosphingobium sp. BL-8A]|uniref:O-antigen ligase family protein n=1 Tax=Novosphingobium sp. BL-8A TaxID=3127639 RepID=UPI003756BA1D